ncbi:MAG TPA: hypothetical protein EYH31_10120 [Anaerolineae bacterium]|nr:hypothetical protein [Anaerolineae bacterium]
MYPQTDVAIWHQRNLFQARLFQEGELLATETFGLEGAAPWRFLGVYFDPYPRADERLEVLTMQQVMALAGDYPHRVIQHHYVALDVPYIESEANLDVERLYRHWSRILGRPAVLYAHADCICPEDLIGLQGEYVVYLVQDLISPEEREVNLVIGHNDGYRVYLNGQMVSEADEMLWWTPYNSIHQATLKAGDNRFVLKLLKRGDTLHFTFGLREFHPDRGFNTLDWLTDLSYRNPLAAGGTREREQGDMP